jgi:hypothetical protein
MAVNEFQHPCLRKQVSEVDADDPRVLRREARIQKVIDLIADVLAPVAEELAMEGGMPILIDGTDLVTITQEGIIHHFPPLP